MWGWETESGHRLHRQRQRMATGRPGPGPEHRDARSLRIPQRVRLRGSDSHLKVLRPQNH